jgi:hypothetical protein
VPSICQEDGQGREEEIEAHHQSSLIYTKPNRKNKAKSNTYVIKKKANTQGSEDEGGAGLEPTHLGAQGRHHQHEGPQMVWVPKAT